MSMLLRGLCVLGVLVAIWQAIVWIAAPPGFILPAPATVAETLWRQHALLLFHAQSTGLVMLGGFAAGALAGIVAALAMASARPVEAALKPALLASQAIPVFALAPLFVLWMGYGTAPKIVMAALVIFFPVALSFADALARVPAHLTDMARVMAGDGPASRLRRLWMLRLPHALPGLATGLRVGAGIAAIAAVIGEWVGASQGLGFLMPWANARAQTPLMFASLAVLIAMSLMFYAAIDAATRRMTPWTPQD